MENSILDKLGIYDLIVLFLSGTCITSFSVVLFPTIFNLQLTSYVNLENALNFLAISFFLGLVFQEIGALIFRKVLNHHRRLLLRSFCSARQTEHVLTEKERTGILKSLSNVPLKDPESLKIHKPAHTKNFKNISKKKTNTKQRNDDIIQDIDILYNYCKFRITTDKATAKADSNQSTAGMSRSLSLYFFVLSILLALPCIPKQCENIFPFFIVFTLLAILLLYRSIRFTLMRYTCIFRTYYYNYLKEQETEQKEKAAKS